MIKELRIFCLLTLLSVSCTTGQKIEDLNYSLIDLQKGISAVVPKGIGMISENRRVFTSKYFDPNSIEGVRRKSNASLYGRERGSVVMTILGDSRPYVIDVDVIIEEDTSGEESKKNDDFIEGKFVVLEHDERLAKYFRNRLANYLARLERNKNIIDDMRPF